MEIGLDKIGFYAPLTYIDMADLAQARGIDPNKYILGLGQDLQAVCPLSQDTVTLGANAASKILDDADKEAIDLVILATESGIDQSKAGATSIHTLLGINPFARCIEIKQACYGATAGLQLAKGHIALNPNKKVLVIASDISRYGLNTGGEATQGVGSVAMLVSAHPKIMTLEADASYFSDDIWDFWRPNYSDVAFVDGKYSNEQYQRLFTTVYEDYLNKTDQNLEDFKAICFHIPYTKLGLKTLKLIADEATHPALFENFKTSTLYNRQVGNIYTGSLYLSLLSLLEQGSLNAGDRIGLYSYGSGAVGEFFSGILQPNYKKHLCMTHQDDLDQRTKLSIPDYEKQFEARLVTDGSHQLLEGDASKYSLESIFEHRRYYKTK
ncbi:MULTISPECIES: hydroxymethylglutaryl-CoA synthase [unclassified Erysipelothrix]|uniref:hydroxymethylglutaryl-CoA synthase n=1 Tax=unclassified Erysipelothrix TaxID=2624170 RepID=UPI00190DA141|nr:MULTISPECIES: hydroxymethylglutaryl-CoA synthase [unclassified Erysipelothrix]MBK2402157.1 hydroxymethylglutaryl-CoA synthase [Erysipelothrix sp. strain 2 (EsS2-6-Brazil)]MBK2404577.1 hydroxymethylglutaryl-CoA synthase [Erysipelothrix sp. strain 2 (EsS2-7-Brazil)]